MKRGLFLLATVTLSSALYAQSALTREEARSVFAAYNPALLEKAAQDVSLNQLIEGVLSQYLTQNPQDTLENRYTLIALARNFENSLALEAVLHRYKQALVYSLIGADVQQAAKAHAREQLSVIYPRIWAVSVQTKQALLAQYKQLRHGRSAEEQPLWQQAIDRAQADLKNLQTATGEQLVFLTKSALEQAQQEVLSQQTALQQQQSLQRKEVKSFHVKTKHKKPVAE